MAASPTPEPVLEFACVRAGGRDYAMDVMTIREILRDRESTPLPGAPRGIEGVIDLDSAVIPVVDLGDLLHGRATPRTASSRVVVTHSDGRVVGMRVEAALDVITAREASLEPAPDVVRSTGAGAAVNAVLRRADQTPIPVLDTRTLIDTLREGVPTQEVAA